MRKQRLVPVTVRLTESTLQALREVAKELGVAQADLVESQLLKLPRLKALQRQHQKDE
jgi:hypothetical protein